MNFPQPCSRARNAPAGKKFPASIFARWINSLALSKAASRPSFRSCAGLLNLAAMDVKG